MSAYAYRYHTTHVPGNRWGVRYSVQRTGARKTPRLLTYHTTASHSRSGRQEEETAGRQWIEPWNRLDNNMTDQTNNAAF